MPSQRICAFRYRLGAKKFRGGSRPPPAAELLDLSRWGNTQSLRFSYSIGAYCRFSGDYYNPSVAWQCSWLGRPEIGPKPIAEDNHGQPDQAGPRAHSPCPDVSLVRGGPFYRAQIATRLIKPDQWNVGRRITFAISVGWVPLLLITILSNRGYVLHALKDYSMNSRMLLAVPVLLLGQTLMETRFRMILEHIYDARLLKGSRPGSSG